MSEILKKVPTDEVVAALYNDLRSRVEAVEPNDAMVAPDYADLTLPILVGTRCTHNRGLYKCNTQINSSEAWDSTHWDEVTVGSELDSLQSEVDDKYEKPSGGIPATDIASGVIPDVSGKTDQGAVATPYGSLTWPVTAGQYCFQNGYVYRAKQNIATSESWTAAHWDQVVLGDEVCRAMNAIQGLEDDKYKKPSGGIPATDLAQAVQTSLSAADSALIGVGKSEERDGIVQLTDTATKNITSGKYVIWKGSLYTASANIATGETLSLSNLDPVDDGGFNDLKTQIINMKKEKFYQKFADYDGTYVNLQQLVPFDVYDEIVILIYQSNTSETAWSNTDWNAFFVQDENTSNIAVASYLKGSVNHIIHIKRYKEVVTAEFVNGSNVPTVNRYITGNSEIKIKRIRIDAVSSTTKAGCTLEVYVF